MENRALMKALDTRSWGQFSQHDLDTVAVTPRRKLPSNANCFGLQVAANGLRAEDGIATLTRSIKNLS